MLAKGVKQMVADAVSQVRSVAPDEAVELIGDPEVLFVDVREQQEIAASGAVAGAILVPRGLLEFQADAESLAHNPELLRGRRLVLYCASGGRSALAAKTLQDMGFSNVQYVPGGFAALKSAGVSLADA